MLPATLFLAQAVTQEPIYGRLRLLEPARAGEYIKFEFSFRNGTRQDIHFVKRLQPLYAVTDRAGNSYDASRVIGCYFSAPTRNELGKLGRGDSYAFRAQTMSIGKPGVYKVRAYLSLDYHEVDYIPLWQGQIWTNEVTIKVGPPRKKPSSR